MNRDTALLGDVWGAHAGDGPTAVENRDQLRPAKTRSDPYVVAQLGDMVQQTPTIDNDLNPVWKEMWWRVP
eukprot:Skav204267  [mRNA]  locus=scaffold912:275666:275878:- [translate_table: standard]